MANPEMVALNSGWMPLFAGALLLAGLLLALKLTAHSDSRGDRS